MYVCVGVWVGGEGLDDTLHHKKVLPNLGILSTDAAYYLSHLLSFELIFWLETHEGEAS